MTEADVRSIARSHTRSMISVLLSVARSKSALPSARVAAAGMVLDRGWGKAAQNVEHDGDVRVTIRHIVEGVDAPRCIDVDTTPSRYIDADITQDADK